MWRDKIIRLITQNTQKTTYTCWYNVEILYLSIKFKNNYKYNKNIYLIYKEFQYFVCKNEDI